MYSPSKMLRLSIAALALSISVMPGLAAAADRFAGASAGPGQAVARHADADPAVRAAQTKQDRLQEAIAGWIQTLAAQTGFEDWRGAAWTSAPLGPGTHGWAVLVSHAGRNVGYLIVTAGMEPGEPYVLTEYGKGSHPLFDPATLTRALAQEGLSSMQSQAEPVYYSPFHAYWKVRDGAQSILVDAKTGERYPATGEPAEIVRYGGSSVSRLAGGKLGTLSEEVRMAAFNPFDRIDWIAGEPTTFRDMESLKQALREGKRITVTVDIFDGEMVLPFALIGYQQWNEGEPYLALDEEGTRYVPYSQVVRWGKLYASSANEE